MSVRDQAFSLLCCDVGCSSRNLANGANFVLVYPYTANCQRKPEEFGSFAMAQRGMSFREATEGGSVGGSCELKCGKQKLHVQWKKTNRTVNVPS